MLLSDGAGGYTLLTAPDPGTLAGVSWSAGRHTPHLGDFDGDGQRDYLLQAQFTGENAVWLVYAFGRYLANSAPEIMAAIDNRCDDKERFRGTLGGGDIFVCRMRPN